ncbi:MAG: dihydroneopterin aldolase [Bdellovibrionota bacterium]
MTVLSKTTGRPLDVITLRDLVVHCVIGVNPEEKIRSQLLRLDIKLYLDVSPAGLSGILSRTVDYSLIAKQLAFILTYSRFRLLESAAEALAVFLLTPAQGEALIQAVDIEIHKPEALGGVAIPSVRIYRDDESKSSWIKANPPSSILFQVPEAVMERKFVGPGAEILIGEGEDTAVLIESAGFVLADKALAIGSTLIGSKRLILHNSNAEERSILAVTFRGQQRFQLAEDRLH